MTLIQTGAPREYKKTRNYYFKFDERGLCTLGAT
jgi:hypothetical protein